MSIVTQACMVLGIIVAAIAGAALQASTRSLVDVFIERSERHMERDRARVLHMVNEQRHEELRLLLEQASPMRRKRLADSVQVDDAANKSALFLACLHRSPTLVEALLWADADVAAGRSDEGTTPLHLAVGWLHSAEIVELLLAARDRKGIRISLGTKPTSGGLRHGTPVYWARFYDQVVTQRKLIAWMSAAGWHYLQEEDVFLPSTQNAE
jgi:hypothetical protein